MGCAASVQTKPFDPNSYVSILAKKKSETSDIERKNQKEDIRNMSVAIICGDIRPKWIEGPIVQLILDVMKVVTDNKEYLFAFWKESDNYFKFNPETPYTPINVDFCITPTGKFGIEEKKGQWTPNGGIVRATSDFYGTYLGQVEGLAHCITETCKLAGYDVKYYYLRKGEEKYEILSYGLHGDGVMFVLQKTVSTIGVYLFFICILCNNIIYSSKSISKTIDIFF